MICILVPPLVRHVEVLQNAVGTGTVDEIILADSAGLHYSLRSIYKCDYCDYYFNNTLLCSFHGLPASSRRRRACQNCCSGNLSRSSLGGQSQEGLIMEKLAVCVNSTEDCISSLFPSTCHFLTITTCLFYFFLHNSITSQDYSEVTERGQHVTILQCTILSHSNRSLSHLSLSISTSK